MLLGAIADDFTGAGDLANTLAKGGMATIQFVGVPSGAAPSTCEAGVVSLKTRSGDTGEAISKSLAAAEWLMAQGCEQILFKYCSTFDSTPQGNIGPVAEALLDRLGADIAIVCPAFPATGRRLFMGHLFVGDRLLSDSGMEKHPLTPMTDPDIRRWLRQQTKGEVGLVALDTVRAGQKALAEAFETERSKGVRLVVTDAAEDGDLKALGAAISKHKLVTGGSGIGIGLAENFRNAGRLSGIATNLATASGGAVALSGSCSIASQRQVAVHLKSHPGLALDPAALIDGRINAAMAADWVAAQGKGTIPIVYSTANPAAVKDAQSSFGGQKLTAKIEQFFADLARKLADGGARRIVVGGGETSGAVVEALDIASMDVGEEIDPGVPALVADRNGPLGLALKSGNFGADDFFEKAAGRIGVP